jgi:hypothetical protein
MLRCARQGMGVGEIRSENDHLAGGFEHGKPGLDRVQGHPEVPGQIGQTEQLGGSRRQSPKEALKLGQIAHLADGAHVPLEVGLDIACVPQVDVTFGVGDQLRIATTQELTPDFPVRGPRFRG